jgi:hypothetical protein
VRQTGPMVSDPPAPGVRLVRGADQVLLVDALADRLGGRVGLAGVLRDLNRSARRCRVPGAAAGWGFRWDRADSWSPRWWPQGIDVGPAEGGRTLLVTSAYAKPLHGEHSGSRVSFVDLSDPDRIRYRHVLLVEPFRSDTDRVDVRPVNVHAGGIVWHDGHLHVAATARGIRTFRVADIMAAPAGGRLGHRYLLPLAHSYDARTDEGTEPMRYSYLSLDRAASPPVLVAGEYGRGEQTTRLARYPVDPATSSLPADGAGASRPVLLSADGVPGTQGAAVVDGRWYLTTSAGRWRRGSLWAGTPGSWAQHAGVLPVGPEALAYSPATGLLWSLTEHPGRRYVFAMPRPD